MDKKIDLTSKDERQVIHVSHNLSSYYSRLAKDWAVSPDKVQNEDYSAKYYAQTAKQASASVQEIADLIIDNADIEVIVTDLKGTNTLSTCAQNMTAIQNAAEKALNIEENLATIETKAQEATTKYQQTITKSEETIAAIEEAKTEVTTLSTNAVSQINTAGTQAVSNVQIKGEYEIQQIQNAASAYSFKDLSNISESGKNVIRGLAQEVGGSGGGSSLPEDIPYVVEEGTYTNSKNYWRLWSSGWVEQWVFVPAKLNGKVSALKWMQPNYWIMAMPIKSESSTDEEKAQPDSIWITKRYSDNRTFDYAWSGGSENDSVCFYICGWIDE